MSNPRDHVFVLQRHIAIKDRQLYEQSLQLRALESSVKAITQELEKYKTANFFLRETLITLESKQADVMRGTIGEGIINHL